MSKETLDKLFKALDRFSAARAALSVPSRNANMWPLYNEESLSALLVDRAWAEHKKEAEVPPEKEY